MTEAEKRHRATAIVDAHVILLAEGRIFLLRRANTGYQDGMFAVLAGHVEESESVAAAAIREALEEAAVKIESDDLKMVHVMDHLSGGQRIAFFFVASKWSGTPTNAEPNKCDQVGWFDLQQLPSNIVEYQRLGINRGLQQQVFSTHGW